MIGSKDTVLGAAACARSLGSTFSHGERLGGMIVNALHWESN